MRISNGRECFVNLEEKEYNELLDRLDKALIKNESLQDEIKELKESIKLKNKVGKSYTKKIKGLSELVEDQAKEIEGLKKHNIYYSSQVKSIKRIAEQPQNSCDNRTILNDIIDVCFDTGIDFDYEKELKKDVEFYRSQVNINNII